MQTPTPKSVALVGRPNVGKSRLFNRLLGRRVSIVHDKPGVTRDVVAEKLSDSIVLMDTGGMGAVASGGETDSGRCNAIVRPRHGQSRGTASDAIRHSSKAGYRD